MGEGIFRPIEHQTISLTLVRLRERDGEGLLRRTYFKRAQKIVRDCITIFRVDPNLRGANLLAASQLM